MNKRAISEIDYLFLTLPTVCQNKIIEEMNLMHFVLGNSDAGFVSGMCVNEDFDNRFDFSNSDKQEKSVERTDEHER